MTEKKETLNKILSKHLRSFERELVKLLDEENRINFS